MSGEHSQAVIRGNDKPRINASLRNISVGRRKEANFWNLTARYFYHYFSALTLITCDQCIYFHWHFVNTKMHAKM